MRDKKGDMRGQIRNLGNRVGTERGSLQISAETDPHDPELARTWCTIRSEMAVVGMPRPDKSSGFLTAGGLVIRV